MKSFLTALFLLALTVCSTNGLAQDLKKQDSKDAQAEVRTTFEKGDFQKTVKLATTALESNPQLSVLLWYRGLSHQKLGKYDAAVQDYQAYLGSAKDKARILNAIAWIHAARPEIPKRQPKTAIELASQACELTGYKDGFNMDTLATAYAADSQFDLAAMIQEKAIEAGLNAHGTAYDRLDDMKAHRVIKDGLAAHKANNPTVIFHNLTSQRLSLRVVKTIDSDGTPTRRDWNYTVMPHKFTSLLDEERRPVVASKFYYRVMFDGFVTPANPANTWVSEYREGRHHRIFYDEAELKNRRTKEVDEVIVAKPALPPSEPDAIDMVVRGVDQINEIRENFSKAKETLGKITGASSTQRQNTDDARLSADVILQSVAVADSKSNGKSWDAFSGPPDLVISFSVNDRNNESTDVFRDQTSASPNRKMVRVRAGDTLQVTVVDDDISVGDTIGTYEKVISEETIRQGEVRWTFGRVTELRLKFEL